jgi:cytochrome c oxidase subunit 2
MTGRLAAVIIGAAFAIAAVGSSRPEGRPLHSEIGVYRNGVYRNGAADLQVGSDQVVDVTAERFSFTPSEIRVKSGTRLQIRLSSEDTDHGFRIPDTDIDVRIPKRNRGTITVTFDAAKPGRYAFQCSHVCGAGHSFMRGEIVVTE